MFVMELVFIPMMKTIPLGARSVADMKMVII
jgi:hypothetical protein